MSLKKLDCWICDLCGHDWIARGEKPKQCAKCRKRGWNRTKAEPETEVVTEKRKGGRVPIAGLGTRRVSDVPQDLEVGGKAKWYPERCGCPFRFGSQQHAAGCKSGT